MGGSALAYLNAVSTRDQYRAVLTDRAATIATALDSEKVAQLKGEITDVELPVYRELQTKLRLIKQSNLDARSIYLSGIKNGQVYFTVDSEVPGSSYYSPPGEPYDEASELYKSVFAGISPAVEGPLTDSYGTWVSGLAPVVDLRTGRTVGVVGMDIDAGDYSRIIITSAAIPLLVTLVFLVILVIYEWNRLRQQRELRMRSELMSIASHELRTPITGMRWAAESLLHTQPDGPTKTIVKAMYDSVLNLQAGTEDILQLTRLQKNTKMQMQPADLVPLLIEICNTQRILAGKKKVAVRMDESWPASLVVYCDSARMKQVFHNLVSNAVKYAKESTVVTISCKRTNKTVSVTVADQGIGIPKDEQGRVFDGFYRASNAKAGGESGTGLGLYLAKTIIFQHHGKISFVSEVDKGTTFTVTLPAIKD
jgi:signal transduction histidine kinase